MKSIKYISLLKNFASKMVKIWFFGNIGKVGKIAKFCKYCHFLFSMCFKHKNTLCVQSSLTNINFWRIYSIFNLQGFYHKKCAIFDDVIKIYMGGPKFQVIFSCSRINFRNFHTNREDKKSFFTVLFQIEIALGTLYPSLRQIGLRS